MLHHAYHACCLVLRFERGKLGTRKQEQRGQRDKRPKKRQPLPVFSAESQQKQRAYDNDTNHAPRIDRVQLAHFTVGIVGGERRNDGTDQHLGKPARCGKHDSADDKPHVDRIGKEKGKQRIDQKSDNCQKRRQLDRERNIEFVREKGKNEVDGQLGEKVDKNQQSL